MESAPVGIRGVISRMTNRLRVSDDWFGVLLAVPALCLLGFVVFWPLARSIMFGFSNYSLITSAAGAKWAGIDNFRRWLEIGSAWEVLRNTAVFTLSTVTGMFLLGLGTALLLNQPIRGRSFFRGVLMIPWILPTSVAVLLWMWILNGQYGIFNFVMQQLGLIAEFQDWLLDARWAMLSVIGVDVWKFFSFDMLILLAGLQTIPPELIEAAKVDGANAVQRFWYVTLPGIRYMVVLVLLLTFIWRVQDFTIIWVLTSGGPVNATTTMVIQIYRTAFENYNIGLAAAMGVSWLAIQVLIALLVVKYGFGERFE